MTVTSRTKIVRKFLRYSEPGPRYASTFYASRVFYFRWEPACPGPSPPFELRLVSYGPSGDDADRSEWSQP